MGLTFANTGYRATTIVADGQWPENGSLSQQMVVGAQAVPGPIVGAGLPGLVAGCVTLLGLARRRRANA